MTCSVGPGGERPFQGPLTHAAADLLAGVDVEAVVDTGPDSRLGGFLADRQQTIAIAREDAASTVAAAVEKQPWAAG